MQVNVQDYGAKGLGNVDETSNFQAALAALPACGGTLFVPTGTYLIGDFIVDKSIVLQGESVWGGYCTVLKVQDSKNGIIISQDGQGSIIRNLKIEPYSGLGVTSPSLDGIVLRGAAATKLENILVTDVGGNGIFINGHKPLNADHWQIENCATFRCGKNGLLVEGYDAQAGLCVSLNTSSNQLWGIAENSALGNAYVACHATTNQAGSYTVNNAAAGTLPVGGANYSSFLACYAEGDNLPDFTNAPYILVVGGSLSSIDVTGTLATGDLAVVGADQRIGTTWSRLTFRQQIPISADGVDTREIDVTIPDLPPTGRHGTLMTFKYTPMINGRKVLVDGQWRSDDWQDAIWNLERYVYDQTNEHEDNYVANSPDRAWVVRTDARTANQSNYGEIVPFGWTDREHPLGPGHFFLDCQLQTSHRTGPGVRALISHSCLATTQALFQRSAFQKIGSAIGVPIPCWLCFRLRYLMSQTSKLSTCPSVRIRS